MLATQSLTEGPRAPSAGSTLLEGILSGSRILPTADPTGAGLVGLAVTPPLAVAGAPQVVGVTGMSAGAPSTGGVPAALTGSITGTPAQGPLALAGSATLPLEEHPQATLADLLGVEVGATWTVRRHVDPVTGSGTGAGAARATAPRIPPAQLTEVRPARPPAPPLLARVPPAPDAQVPTTDADSLLAHFLPLPPLTHAPELRRAVVDVTLRVERLTGRLLGTEPPPGTTLPELPAPRTTSFALAIPTLPVPRSTCCAVCRILNGPGVRLLGSASEDDLNLFDLRLGVLNDVEAEDTLRSAVLLSLPGPALELSRKPRHSGPKLTLGVTEQMAGQGKVLASLPDLDAVTTNSPGVLGVDSGFAARLFGEASSYRVTGLPVPSP